MIELMGGMLSGMLRTTCRAVFAAVVVVALLAGCSSTAAPDSDKSSTGGGSAPSSNGASVADRIKAPCGQIPIAKLNAAFGTTFDPGTVDNTIPAAPTCTWTGKTFDVSLSLYPALESDYETELNDTSDMATYERTQPKFGDDSTLSVDKVLPRTTTLSVLSGDLEWIIDADKKGASAGRAQLLALAKTLF